MQKAVEDATNEDMKMLCDMHHHAIAEVRKYLEDAEGPAHLPNALYTYCSKIENAILRVHANKDFDDAEAYGLTRDIIVMVLLTGMKVGEAGIKLDLLTGCDCHMVDEDELTIEAFQSMMDDLRKDDM
jgi:hypothetical protein